MLADAKYREWEMPANSDSNFWTYLDERTTLRRAGAYQRYIGRMRDIPRYFDENIANMHAGLKRGFTPPAATLVGRDGSIATFSRTEPKTAASTRVQGHAVEHQRRRAAKLQAPRARRRSNSR